MLKFFDTFFKTWEIADDIIDAIKAARQPDSDGGIQVTGDELYEIGMHFMEKIAEVAGVPLEIKDKK
jgi:hypothetical protein